MGLLLHWIGDRVSSKFLVRFQATALLKQASCQDTTFLGSLQFVGNSGNLQDSRNPQADCGASTAVESRATINLAGMPFAS
ncbi:hypothetical protein DSM3645_29736 [Blastopirellula marina DSM 3645]|uniref:Uncharacterized protein n=1 Tax=Blastopirellula marina DSM 3645 TaxID=314230 RepID=A3ZXH7_9BACT|nr:hypothetical protein DSM3645_29736 [Blastopirellula marina DSM 3645]